MHTHRKKSTHMSTVLYIFMFICLNIYHISVLGQTAKSSLFRGHLQADLHTHKVMTKPHFCSGKLTIKRISRQTENKQKQQKSQAFCRRIFSAKKHMEKKNELISCQVSQIRVNLSHWNRSVTKTISFPCKNIPQNAGSALKRKERKIS